MAVRANAEHAPRRDEGRGWEQAIAQIRFCRRTDPDDRTRPCDRGNFPLGQMRGMDQTPGRIDRIGIVEMFDRASANPGDAVIHFSDLLGYVDMHGHRGIIASQCRQDRQKCVGSDGAKRVRRNPDPNLVRSGMLGAQSQNQVQKRLRIMAKPPLALGRRFRAKAALGIEHGQQGQPDSGRDCRGRDPIRHLGLLGIETAVGLMMQIMELAHARVAGFQHLRVEQARYRLHLGRCKAFDKAVHHVPPGPEILAFGRSTGLRQPDHGALEGMTVQIGHPRQHRPRQLHGSRRRALRVHAGQESSRIGFQADIVRPARGG